MVSPGTEPSNWGEVPKPPLLTSHIPSVYRVCQVLVRLIIWSMMCLILPTRTMPPDPSIATQWVRKWDAIANPDQRNSNMMPLHTLNTDAGGSDWDVNGDGSQKCLASADSDFIVAMRIHWICLMSRVFNAVKAWIYTFNLEKQLNQRGAPDCID